MDQARKRQAISQTYDVCSNMISDIRQLRLSVLDLFNTLADNGPDPCRMQQMNQDAFLTGNKVYHQQALANLSSSHTLCSSSRPQMRVQRQQEQQQHLELIQYVNQMISSITATIRNLDQDMMLLSQNAPLINLGESAHITFDCSLDKHNLYMDLCKSYKTFAELNEYSAHCHGLLLQQSLKRVHKRYDSQYQVNHSQGSQQHREQRIESIVATFNPYIYKSCLSKTSISSLLETSLRKCEFIEGTYSQTFGTSTGVLQMSINKVLRAVVLMRGIVIDAVIVKAYHESFASKHSRHQGDANLSPWLSSTPSIDQFVNPDEDIDLWSESKYLLFKKLTHHANAAVLHFQYPTYPEIAVRSFLSWFNSFSDLFSATCCRCNSRLRKFTPPICRDFSTGFHAHHDSCR